MKPLQIGQVEGHEEKFFTDVCERIRALRPELPSFEESIKNASDEPHQQTANRLAYLGILLKETGLWGNYLKELKEILGRLPTLEKDDDVFSFGQFYDHCLAANNAVNSAMVSV